MTAPEATTDTSDTTAAGLAIDRLIRARRTNLRVDPERSLDPVVVADLCRLATWAPNHHRTTPWQFAVFSGDGRRLIGDLIADALAAAGEPQARVAKARTKYLRAPVMLLVGSLGGDDETTAGENRDAVAAGIQNLLLAATARGLASYWSSAALPRLPELLELCRFAPGSYVVGCIYLGYPLSEMPAPERSEPQIHWVE